MDNHRGTLFTSESVTEGHPDKIADQISDAILDEALAQDPTSRVACETLLTTGLVIIAGEITTNAHVDYAQVARETIRKIGYDRAKYGFDCDTCSILSAVNRQSPDIAMGVDTGGAGDQGLMFGFACNETPELMPLPIQLAHRLAERLTETRKSGQLPYLRPDGKSQVTVEYRDGRPFRVDAVVISSQHAPEIENDQLRSEIAEHVIRHTVPGDLMDDGTKYHIIRQAASLWWSTGRFGLTGRKIIVDTYGGYAPTVAARFLEKIRRRSTVPRHTWRVTWPRILSPPVWRNAVRYNSPTRSAWLSLSLSTSILTAPDASTKPNCPSLSAITSRLLRKKLSKR